MKYKLIFNRIHLQDSKMLKEYGIQKEARLRLLRVFNDAQNDNKNGSQLKQQKLNANANAWIPSKLKLSKMEAIAENGKFKKRKKYHKKLSESKYLNHPYKYNPPFAIPNKCIPSVFIDEDLKNEETADGESTNIHFVVNEAFILNSIPLNVRTIYEKSVEEITDYLNKSMALSHGLCGEKMYRFQNDTIRVINFGFYEVTENKENNELYGILQRKNQTEWSLMDHLYTSVQIRNQFKIPIEQLPQSVRKSMMFKTEQKMGSQIKKILMSFSDQKIGNEIKKILMVQKIVQKTPWHNQKKVPMYKRYNGNKQMTLTFQKQTFIRELNENINSKEDMNLIPIIMFDNVVFSMHFVWVVTIDRDQSIGISFRIDQNRLIVTGIHLDKQYLQQQHQLVDPCHECHCLDSFKSNINDFRIVCHDPLWYQEQFYKLNKYTKIIPSFKKFLQDFICVDKNHFDIKSWIGRSKL
eukprot:91124_1